jgi:putative hydrolase of the HAD superfamily
VLRRLDIDPADALMIGDWAERDVVGAKSLGMRTAFARYGDTFDTKVSGADHDVDDLLELLRIVDEVNGAPPAPGGIRRD